MRRCEQSSVLWCYWLGGRKGIRPVKTEWWGTVAWLSVWSEVQMICIWSSWCHCHPVISCSSKIQNSLPFWCWLTQVVLEKRPLYGCSSSRTRRWEWLQHLITVSSTLQCIDKYYYRMTWKIGPCYCDSENVMVLVLVTFPTLANFPFFPPGNSALSL